MFRFARKVWHRLPLDGAGVIPLGSTRILQKTAARGFWQRVSVWYRVPAIIVVRLLWLFACPVLAVAECRRAHGDLSDLLAGLWDGWTRGKTPANTILRRKLARGDRLRTRMVRDLPGDRQGILFLATLGNAADAALAADKLESMQALARLGLRVPAVHGVVPRGQVPHMDEAPWTIDEKMLVKPRHGMAARGLFSVRSIGDGHFIVGGKTIVSAAQLAERLTRNAQRDSLLVQSYVGPCAPILDLSPSAPAAVRVSVFRSAPRAAVAVANAEMKIPPPDLDAPLGVTGQLLIPINVAAGTLEDGILLSRPGERWPRSPWNDAPVRGRPVPEWAELCEMVIRASAILPDTPLIGWDVLLGPEGPVILEANTSVGLFRVMLWNFEKGIPSPLPGALEAWRLAREGNPDPIRLPI